MATSLNYLGYLNLNILANNLDFPTPIPCLIYLLVYNKEPLVTRLDFKPALGCSSGDPF